MNIVTGVFDAVNNAEDTVKALIEAGFPPDEIGVAVHDRGKGERLASELDRQFRWPSGDEFTGSDAVYDRLPNAYLETIRRSNIGDRAADWYHVRFDEGRILVIVNAGSRSDDVRRIIRDSHGVLYRGEAEREQPATEQRLPMPLQLEQPKVEGESRPNILIGTAGLAGGVPIMREEIRVERRKLDAPMRPEDYTAERVPAGEIHVPIVESDYQVIRTPIVREVLVITRVPVEGNGEERRAA